jgi:hypothetical protein
MHIRESRSGWAGRHGPSITNLGSYHYTSLVGAKCSIPFRAINKLKKVQYISYKFQKPECMSTPTVLNLIIRATPVSLFGLSNKKYNESNLVSSPNRPKDGQKGAHEIIFHYVPYCEAESIRNVIEIHNTSINTVTPFPKSNLISQSSLFIFTIISGRDNFHVYKRYVDVDTA